MRLSMESRVRCPGHGRQESRTRRRARRAFVHPHQRCLYNVVVYFDHAVRAFYNNLHWHMTSLSPITYIPLLANMSKLEA
jgi:hypothetical protein